MDHFGDFGAAMLLAPKQSLVDSIGEALNELGIFLDEGGSGHIYSIGDIAAVDA